MGVGEGKGEIERSDHAAGELNGWMHEFGNREELGIVFGRSVSESGREVISSLLGNHKPPQVEV